jgi:hypothetical protein
VVGMGVSYQRQPFHSLSISHLDEVNCLY